MGSRITNSGAEKVYEAASAWVKRALYTDDSLFTPGKEIWSGWWLKELWERFLNGPDVPGDDFMQKLELQLAGSPPEVYQLMGEALYFHFLIVSTKDSTDEQRIIDRVLQWSPSPVTIPPNLITGLTPGIATPGPFFHRNRQFQIGFLIEFVLHWKDHREYGRLADPWAFKDFVTHFPFQSMLLRDSPSRSHMQREALLHLVFPDTFEPIISTIIKNDIAGANDFKELVKEPTDDVDFKLLQIRQAVQTGLENRDHLFFQDNIRGQWDPKYRSDSWGLWDMVRKYLTTRQLDAAEIEYKINIGAKLTEVREAVLNDTGDWIALLKAVLPSQSGHPMHWQSGDSFRRWINRSPDGGLRALQAIWKQDDSPVSDRIRAFSELLPLSEIEDTDHRLNVASVLLMGLDVEQYPPFRWDMFYHACEYMEYNPLPKWGIAGSEVAMYEHALDFLDWFIEVASKRGLILRHRLEAQSVVWEISGVLDYVEGDEPPPMQLLAKELYFDGTSFLENIEILLYDKKQVIFQGPPGTGKTYVAQKLARHLAGSEERVTLVQFHPSYAYEDFVQGFRPTLKDGQPGFELRDGPLLRAAEAAREDPDEKHFLIIDEINRGQIAKVLGELYFLLEYRDETIRLQYSDEPFSLPSNLYIIGTMNTADRSIALVDLALRRRFYFVEFHPDDEPVKGVLRRWLKAKGLDGMEWVADVVERANEKMKDDRHAAVGPSYFMKDRLNQEVVARIWRHSVLPYIEERRFGEDDSRGEFGLKALRKEAERGRGEEGEGEGQGGDGTETGANENDGAQ